MDTTGFQVKKDGLVKGPFSQSELLLLIKSGEFQGSDLVISGGFFTTAGKFAAAAQNSEYQIPWEELPPEPVNIERKTTLRVVLESRPKLILSRNIGPDLIARGALSCGVFCSVVSILFWPAITAFTAFLCGIFLFFRGRTLHGAVVVLLALLFGTIGLILSDALNGDGSLATHSNTDMNLRDLAATTRTSVVKVNSYGEKGEEIGTGTGFSVEPGFIVTNYHVVEGAHQVTFTRHNGENIGCSDILKLDRRRDLAVLKPSHSISERLLIENRRRPEEGERIAVIGSPLGFDGTLSEGIVSANREDDNGVSFIQISAPISPGSSGSPVVNSNGRLIGIATMYFEGGQSLNFAVSAKELEEIIQQIQP
jgi:S1-C subfamily serine protease